MIHSFFKKIKSISKISFRFDTPKKNKLLLFDEIHLSVANKLFKKNFNILETRNKKIYFWIYLKQIIFFDFKFQTYCVNYIKFTSPKVVISFNESRPEMYELKNSFKNIKFIAIVNGIRSEYWFNKNKKLWPKNLKCDYFFVLNKHFIPKYQKLIKSEYRILGHFRNNLVNYNKTKFHKQFLFLSMVHEGANIPNNEYMIKFHTKLLSYINLYLSNYNKKLHILLRRSKENSRQKLEIDHYKKIFKSNCIFHENTQWEKKYELLDKFENIIFTYTAMGYEAIARKKKVAVFAPSKINNFDEQFNFKYSKYHFGWPAPHKNEYNFFSTQNLTYKQVERVLNNVNNCSQIKWDKKYYSFIKDQMYFDKNNEMLRKFILKLLN